MKTDETDPATIAAEIAAGGSGCTVFTYTSYDEAHKARQAETIHADEYAFCLEALCEKKKPWVIIVRSPTPLTLHNPALAEVVAINIPFPYCGPVRASNGGIH